VATALLEERHMNRMIVALVSLALLAGCAGSSAGSHYSVVPQVDVKVKEHTKRVAQANYQAAPQDKPVTGSGGSR
jgi:uncharacterized lipoprotein YajG